MFARFFIERPIFAWVIAIVIMLAGVLAIRTLPVSQYPNVAPPQVTVTANFPGASAEALENSVTQVLEQQLQGIDRLIYFSSNSSSAGQAQITATFEQGADPDVAQVQIQNKVQQALTRLPQQVQQQGVVVAKAQPDFLLIVGIYDESDQRTNIDIADYLVSNFQDPLSRVKGVGNVQVFGSQYAMRIWLDPFKLRSFSLIPADVVAAIQAQNVQVSAGEVGGLPAPPGQQLNATVTAQARLQTPEQFQNILLRTQASGAQVHLRDVARVEKGAENYSVSSRLNGHPSAGMAILLAPGANALNTSDAVKARVAQLSRELPPGVKVLYPRDSTAFVRLSIEEVIKTLAIAIVLVVVVMFVFLQNWRATLIPAIAVPVVLLGTFGVLAAAGFSINTLTLFGMVLAIGLLVDDAIVVVENVERVMTEEGLPPKEATAKSMDEITGALVAIALVLSAVFLPMAFFGGSTGVIYRQFSVTIVAAMALSVVVALTLTPALCATLLRPTQHDHAHQRGPFGWFNRTFDRGVDRYEGGLKRIFRRRGVGFAVFAGIAAVMALLFVRLPTGFLPQEDQGAIIVSYQLPTGATQGRTLEVGRQLERYFLEDEKETVAAMFSIAGFSFAGSGQNAGLAFLALKDWDERKGKESRADAVANRAMARFGQTRDAQVFVLAPPAIQGLGQSNGFDMQLQDTGGIGRDRLAQAQGRLLGLAAQDPRLAAVRPNGLQPTPQLQVEVDQTKAAALGLGLADVNGTLSAAWGGAYVNDFIDRGRVKRVFVQGDAPYRARPEDLQNWFVRGTGGEMAPFSAFSSTRWTFGPQQLQRFNGLPSFNIQGQAGAGRSSGEALQAMTEAVRKLPPGVGLAWSGLSYQELLSSGQAPLLYALSLLIVFLCLAALYESWSVPVAVLLVIPLGVLGAVLATTLRGLQNDVYFQVGLLTIIGLSAKNAILIVEFAELAVKNGKGVVEATLEASRQRLRPILMTSLAFIAGVFPLAISTGPGAGSQNDIGTGVVGGMLTATLLGIFFVPLFYVTVRGIGARLGRRKPQSEPPPAPDQGEPA